MTDLQQIEARGRIEALWKVIGRFDLYINSTNTKTTILLAFNTFVVSSILLKWTEIINLFEGAPTRLIAVAILLSIAGLAALASAAFLFAVIYPSRNSFKSLNEYQSIIFYDHVAEFSREKYLEAVKTSDLATLEKDLSFQAHALATALRSKFNRVELAVKIAVIGELLPIALLIVIKIAIFF